MAINIGAVSIYQDIELSLTEHLVPPVVHVKQFDHMARKVRCALYNNAVEYTIPANVILAYSGTRPDGRLFQYSTESLHNDKVDVVGNRIIVTISDFMTEVSGRYPVDLVMIDADGDILGSFSFTLYVEKAANKNRKILTATYTAVAEAVRQGVFECFITDDGYFGINSDDGLGLGTGSYSATVERVHEVLVDCSIDDGGYMNFETDERLGLVYQLMYLLRKYKRPLLKARYAELRAGVMSEENVALTFENFMVDIMNWSIDRRFSRGIFLTPELLGYDRDENGELVINPQEAETVKVIYSLSSKIMYSVYDPKEIQGDLNTFSYDERVKISTALSAAYKKASEASTLEMTDKDQKAAISKWGEVLGYAFPDYS